MEPDKKDQETIIQNKIAIAVFNITLFVALVGLFESMDSIFPEIKRVLYSIMGIPALFYFLFLLFLPLRYKQEYPYTFRFLEIFEISEIIVNKLYDLASSSIFLMIYSAFSVLVIWGLPKFFNQYNIQINSWVIILISGTAPFLLMKVIKRVLNLKYADYVEDNEYRKHILKKQKKR